MSISKDSGSPSSPPLLVRADSDLRIGAGHVMRCIALAQAWRDGGRGPVTFLSASMLPVHEEMLSREGFLLEWISSPSDTIDDALRTVAATDRLGARALITDGYTFGDDHASVLSRARHLRHLVVDDGGIRGVQHGHLLLDSNPSAELDTYREFSGQLLLGCDFLPLRREFRDAPTNAPRSVVEHILVTLGGSDATDTLLSILTALGDLRERNGLRFRVTVLYGGCANRAEEVERCHPASWLRFHTHTSDVVRFFRSSDLVVSGAGSTTWELARLGVPAVLVALAANQEPVGEAAERLGTARYLGRDAVLDSEALSDTLSAALTEPTRASMSQVGPRIVDGQGATRVGERLATLCLDARVP